MSPEERARAMLNRYGINADVYTEKGTDHPMVPFLVELQEAARQEEREACAAVAGTMAERPYDVEPEFSACLAIEAAIRQRGET